MMRARLTLLVVTLVWLMAGDVSPALGESPVERAAKIKAAWLYNFVKFVEWPEAAIGDRETIELCVLGVDPFGSALDALEGKLLEQKRVAIKRLRSANGPGSCRILFISASEEPRLPEIVSSLGRSNVLTVGDTAGFIEAGGIIGRGPSP